MDAKPESPEKVEHRSWRRWAVWSTAILLFALAPVVALHLYDASLASESDRLVAELDRTEPGWRTRPAKREPLPASADSMAVMRRVWSLLPRPSAFEAPALPGDNVAPYVRRGPCYLLPADAKESLETSLKSVASAMDCARALKDLPEGRYDPDPVDGPSFPSSVVSEYLQCAALDRMQRGEARAAWEMCRAHVNVVKPIREGDLRMGEWRAQLDGWSVGIVERVLGLGEVHEDDLAAMQRSFADEARFDFVFTFLPEQCDDSMQLHDDMLANRVDVTEKLADYLAWPAERGKLGWWDQLNERYPRHMILQSKVEVLHRVTAVLPLRPLRGFARYEAIGRLDRDFKAREPADQTLRFVWNPADMFVTEQRTIALLGCAEVGLAAERFRLKFGRWPATADELIDKRLLPAVPEDPYDGKPLRFRATADGIVIHSVGAKKSYDGTWYDDPTHGPGEFGDEQPPEFRLWNPERRRQPAPS